MKDNNEILIEVCKFLEDKGHPPEEAVDLILELALKLTMFTAVDNNGVIYRARAGNDIKEFVMTIEANPVTAKPDLTLVH